MLYGPRCEKTCHQRVANIKGADQPEFLLCLISPFVVRFLVGFVALRPKSTAMVIAGRSVHLTTLFPGQA